jgi:hypothetical protein
MGVGANAAGHPILAARIERFGFRVLCGQRFGGADLLDAVALYQECMIFENPIFSFPGNDICICHKHG